MSVAVVHPELRRLEALHAPWLVAFRCQGLAPLSGLLSVLDWRLGGRLSRLVMQGFLSSEIGETLLVPLGRKLGGKHLLIIGMGEPGPLGETLFTALLDRLWAASRGLKARELAVSLPGRDDDTLEPTRATEWLLAAKSRLDDPPELTLIEPAAIQRVIQPLLDKDRMRRAVTRPA